VGSERRSEVSIPSSGSIQFLHFYAEFQQLRSNGLNPLKRVNSILTLRISDLIKLPWNPVSIPSSGSIQFLPAKSTMNHSSIKVSIPSSGSIQFLPDIKLNLIIKELNQVSIPSSGSIQFLHGMGLDSHPIYFHRVSIPSSGSIQFLLEAISFLTD